VALVTFAVLPVRPAYAQSVDHARRLYLDAEFQDAASEFELVLARPSVDIDEAAESHRYLAVLRSMLHDEAAARAHAEAAVALDPAIVAPEGAPPDVATIFEEARRATGGRRAAIAIEASERLRAGAPAHIAARLDPAPAALASQIGLRCVSGETAAEESAAPPEVTVAIERVTDTVHCRAWAGTGATRLVRARADLEIGEDGAGAAGGLGSTGSDADDDGGGGSAWPWIAVGGAVVAVGVGVTLLLLGPLASGDTAELGAPRVDGW